LEDEMAIPIAIRRGARVVALGILLALASCRAASPPTVAPVDPTATAVAPVGRGATPTVPAPAAPATPDVARPFATVTRAAPTATPDAGDVPHAATGTAAARVTAAPSATAVPPAPTPRRYAADDPCAPYAAGNPPPTGRAVVAAPVRICIPALALSAPVVPVGVTPAGVMAEPDDPGAVGWYAPGPPPGALGNAALDGKVDNRGTGPAIFWELARLQPGDNIVIVDRAGTARRFVVTETAVYRREEAPLTRIFGPAADANLALITGAGTWDPAAESYDSNLIVYARLQP
jgi:hypothetical protein